MSWWDSVISSVTRSRNTIVAPQYMEDNRSKKATLTTPEWVTNPMFGSPRRINFTELEDYEEDITVQAAINYIIDSVATCEWDIIVDEEEEIDNKEVITFFKSAKWEDSFETVLRGFIADTLLYDSGVAVITFPEFCYDDNKNLIKYDVKPLSLRARDGRSFIKQVDVYGDIIKYWQYSFLHLATAPVEFDKDEIIYIQERPSSRSPYGTSKLEVVKNVADLMMAIQLGHRSEQENAIQLGGIISHIDVVDVEKLKRLKEMYNSNLQGERNKSKWLVTGGNVEIKPIKGDVADSTWIPGCEFYQQQILAIFKVPKTVLGITSSDTNRATSISQNTSFKRYGVATMMTLVEEILTRNIVKKYFNDKLSFKFVREIDLTDESIRADIDAKNVQTGIITVNEIRARDGREEIEEPDIDPQTGYPYGYGEESEGEDYSDEEETPEESVEKKVKVKTLENEAVDEMNDWNEEQETEVLRSLSGLYGF